MAFKRSGKFPKNVWRQATMAVVFAFLFSQLHALSHAAEFGDDLHKHHGVPCAVQLLCEAGKSLSAPVAPVASSIALITGTVAYRQLSDPLPRQLRRGHLPIRGPPALLF